MTNKSLHANELRFLLKRNMKIVSFRGLSEYHPLWISAIGELGINIRECIRLLDNNYGAKFEAKNDLGVSGAKDVSELINRLRNSYAHSSTTRLKVQDQSENRISWCFQFGKGTFSSINGVELMCPYEDDCGIIFGKNVVLFKRHLMLAHQYCALAAKHVLPEEFRNGVPLVNDPIVSLHPFWNSEENDLNLPQVS